MTRAPRGHRAWYFALLLALLCLTPAGAEEPFRTDVFVSGEGGYHTYRIPALTVTPRNTLLAFCEGRKTSRADHGDLDLLLRRSKNNGETWEPVQLIYEEGGDAAITIGNPCPVVDRDTGRIWLPFCRDNDDVLITFSDDDGVSWAEPRVITRDVKDPAWDWYATGPGVGIQLRHGAHAGRLVIPCDHSQQIDGQRIKYSHAMFSDDHGQTWQLGGTIDRHTDECQVVELDDGRLMMNIRNYWGRDGKQPQKDKMRAMALSEDGGQTWGALQFDARLVEPICQAGFLKYVSPNQTTSKVYLFSNPASATTRHQLTVRMSRDEAASWPVARLLHPGPSAYSCLTVLHDGSIGCLYEGGEQQAYEKLIFARFTVDWLNSDGNTGVRR
jgi:sialidase-1